MAGDGAVVKKIRSSSSKKYFYSPSVYRTAESSPYSHVALDYSYFRDLTNSLSSSHKKLSTQSDQSSSGLENRDSSSKCGTYKLYTPPRRQPIYSLKLDPKPPNPTVQETSKKKSPLSRAKSESSLLTPENLASVYNTAALQLKDLGSSNDWDFPDSVIPCGSIIRNSLAAPAHSGSVSCLRSSVMESPMNGGSRLSMLKKAPSLTGSPPLPDKVATISSQAMKKKVSRIPTPKMKSQGLSLVNIK